MKLHRDWFLQEFLINSLMTLFNQPHRKVIIKKKKKSSRKGIKINNDLNSLRLQFS